MILQRQASLGAWQPAATAQTGPLSSARFKHFVAIDWSGAVGERQRGIAVALCDARGDAPQVMRPAHVWSRQEVLGWLLDGLPPNTLVGLDLGIALPHADCGAYFPGWNESPHGAKALWALVDSICTSEPALGANAFVDHPVVAEYFRRHGQREGARFHDLGAAHRRGRLRVTEQAQAERLGCRPTSNFNLVGAAQVGKASLTGMRVLHRLDGRLPIWPFDPLSGSGSAIVEIYTAIPAIAGGRTAGTAKMRSIEALNTALAVLGCPPVLGDGPLDDHRADALLGAAWLRTAAPRPDLWEPPSLTPALARTEGWTFGVA